MNAKLECLNGPRSKVARSNIHIGELRDASNPLKKNLFDLLLRQERSHLLLIKPDIYSLVYVPRISLTEHFAAIIGDAINNLREALDHLVNRLIQYKLNKSAKAAFPFGVDDDNLRQNQHFKSLHKTYPQFAEFIAGEIQPTRSINPELWSVTSLSNQNKHNDMIPLISATGISGVIIETGTNKIEGISIYGNANDELKLVRSDMPINVSGIPEVIIEMTFLGDGPFGGKNVLESLRAMENAVSNVIEKCERYAMDIQIQ